MVRVASAVAGVVAIIAPRVGLADEAAPAPPVPPVVVQPPPPASEQPLPVKQRSREIKIEVPGERSLNNKLAMGGLAAGSVIATALGVYWHLDSRDASDAVAADAFTGKAWTEAQISLLDRAERSRTRAIVAYSVGGAILIGTIAAWIVTAPASETTIIRTGVSVAPTEHGGAVASKMWSF